MHKFILPVYLLLVKKYKEWFLSRGDGNIIGKVMATETLKHCYVAKDYQYVALKLN